jgi:hypothetical protein
MIFRRMKDLHGTHEIDAISPAASLELRQTLPKAANYLPLPRITISIDIIQFAQQQRLQ